MDSRKALASGFILKFPGMVCTIEEEIGRGSESIIYKGSYPDMFCADDRHTVLIKELFPYHPKGLIYRAESGEIIHSSQADAVWESQMKKFGYGNSFHIKICADHPESAITNFNSFSMNGTVYTVIGYTSGRSLYDEIVQNDQSLYMLILRIIGILDALQVFHDEGFMHLDIAPDNILILGKGLNERYMIIDYNSFSPVKSDNGGCFAALTSRASYTAPEIRTGNIQAAGIPSDLYSITAVFFRCLTGQALTPSQLIRRNPPDVSGCPMLSGFSDQIRKSIQKILARGLAVFPQKRYQNAAEMQKDFCELGREAIKHS